MGTPKSLQTNDRIAQLMRDRYGVARKRELSPLDRYREARDQSLRTVMRSAKHAGANRVKGG